MTREAYLQELKKALAALPVAEQTEAVEYYASYFDEAGNDEEVMQTLGTPTELAKTILDKFTSVPAEYRPEENKSSEGGKTYRANEVRNLEITVGAAEVVIATGDRYSVEYKNMDPGDIVAGITGLGTLTIKNTATVRNFTFWMRRQDEDKVPSRILIKVPRGASLDFLKINVGAGSLVTKGVEIHASKLSLGVGAGNLSLKNILGGSGTLSCGVGNFDFEGSLTGKINADCGVGKLSMLLNGRQEDYSFEASVGLGSVQFNAIQKSGIGKVTCEQKKANHIDSTCGVGYVKIVTSDFR